MARGGAPMTRISIWLAALTIPLLLWHECGEDIGVFCYRIGLGAFTSLRSRALVPVPVRDSLLVTAGILSAGGVIPLTWLLIPVMLCAIVGDQIGYWIGRSAGAALYRREDSLFFRKSHLQRAHDFYEKYGGRAVILARFVPIIRTFCPPVAGAAKMAYSRYLAFDIFGGIFWVSTMILGSYSLGHLIPNIAQRIHYVIAVVILLSILPVIVSLLRARGAAAAPTAGEK